MREVISLNGMCIGRVPCAHRGQLSTTHPTATNKPRQQSARRVARLQTLAGRLVEPYTAVFGLELRNVLG